MTFSSAIWNLGNIITEARGITGRPDQTQISDEQMTYYANFFYQFVLPKQLKIFWGYTYHQFFTVPGQDQYTASPNFQTFNPGATVDGFPLEWYETPDTFYQDYPLQTNKILIGPTNALNNYSFSITYFPLVEYSVYITDGLQVGQDNGKGGFWDPKNHYVPLPGSINYATGVVTGFSFAVTSAANTNLTVTYETYVPARPRGILFFRSQFYPDATQATINNTNMFVIRPIPNQVHLIKMQAIQVPAPLDNATDVPFRADLGPLIALGMSLHIFKVFNQMDQYQQILGEYEKYKDICMQDTYEEMLYMRSVPTF